MIYALFFNSFFSGLRAHACVRVRAQKQGLKCKGRGGTWLHHGAGLRPFLVKNMNRKKKTKVVICLCVSPLASAAFVFLALDILFNFKDVIFCYFSDGKITHLQQQSIVFLGLQPEWNKWGARNSPWYLLQGLKGSLTLCFGTSITLRNNSDFSKSL